MEISTQLYEDKLALLAKTSAPEVSQYFTLLRFHLRRRDFAQLPALLAGIEKRVSSADFKQFDEIKYRLLCLCSLAAPPAQELNAYFGLTDNLLSTYAPASFAAMPTRGKNQIVSKLHATIGRLEIQISELKSYRDFDEFELCCLHQHEQSSDRLNELAAEIYRTSIENTKKAHDLGTLMQNCAKTAGQRALQPNSDAARVADDLNGKAIYLDKQADYERRDHDAMLAYHAEIYHCCDDAEDKLSYIPDMRPLYVATAENSQLADQIRKRLQEIEWKAAQVPRNVVDVLNAGISGYISQYEHRSCCTGSAGSFDIEVDYSSMNPDGRLSFHGHSMNATLSALEKSQHRQPLSESTMLANWSSNTVNIE